MTIKLRYLLLLLCIGPWTQAQVKIGNNPQDLDPASILELESTSRALVISRMTTAQMNAITPLKGAIIYNIDADCLYYYNGSNWINLCEASGGPFTFTTDPGVNPISTIKITQTGNNYNFEVGEITGNNIVNGSINGFSDIQDGTISSAKLQDRAVGPKKLEEGAVSSYEIENQSILTIDIAPEGPNKVLSTDSNGAVQWQDKGSLAAVTDKTITGAGTVGDPLKVSVDLTTAIAKNTTDIADHIAVDGDTDSNNELQTLSEVLALGAAANGRITDLNDPAGPQDAATRAYVDSAIIAGGANGSETKLNEGANISITGTGTTPDPYIITNTFTEVDGDITNEIQNLEINGDQLSISEGNTITIPTSNGSDTQLQDGTNIEITGTGIAGDPYVINNTYEDGDGDATNELTDLSFDGTFLTLTNPLTPGHSVDLSGLSGGGTTELADQVTIVGDGQAGTEFQVADNSISPAKIQAVTPAPATDQMLITSTTGTVEWVDYPAISTIPVGTIGSIFFSDGAGSLLENNTNLLWDNANERLGIGTATPDAKLHVNGDFHLTKHLLDELNSAGTAGQVLTSTATGTAWASITTPVAMGKVAGDGGNLNVQGATATRTGLGEYTVVFSIAMPDPNYIIQLSVEGDNRIYITAQNTDIFIVEVKDNNTDALIDANWHFTILN